MRIHSTGGDPSSCKRRWNWNHTGAIFIVCCFASLMEVSALLVVPRPGLPIPLSPAYRTWTPNVFDGHCIHSKYGLKQSHTARSHLSASVIATHSDSSELVDDLLHAVATSSNEDSDSPDLDAVEQSIPLLIESLEESFQHSPSTSSSDDVNEEDEELNRRFKPLLGLYNVMYVLSKKAGENPVGGKWTRRARSEKKSASQGRTMESSRVGWLALRHAYQHLLPIEESNSTNHIVSKTAVARAVNVIVLDILWNRFRIHVLLEGLAIPLFSNAPKNQADTNTNLVANTTNVVTAEELSNLAVEAKFDSPRILFSRPKGRKEESGEYKVLMHVQLGPKSSVILDTTHVDDRIRIGKGGTSGTRFIFGRVPSSKTFQATEYQSLLLQKPNPLRKRGLVARLGLGSTLGTVGGIMAGPFRIVKILAWTFAAVSTLLLIPILFSTGGIEEDDDDAQRQKELIVSTAAS
eukprot:scaffold70598_cov60-Attheya_sp.AAC.6